MVFYWVIPLVCIFSRSDEIYDYKNVCRRAFVAAIIHKSQKLNVHQQENKQCVASFSYHRKYLALNGKLYSQQHGWISRHLLSKRSQTQNSTQYRIHLYGVFKTDKKTLVKSFREVLWVRRGWLRKAQGKLLE